MSKLEEFELTEQHIKLLSNAIIGWQDCEFGAPEIDPKRPYGNSSVLLDIAELLGEKGSLCPHCSEPIKDIDEEKYNQLHRETETALEVILSVKSFEPGIYVCDGHSWKKK